MLLLFVYFPNEYRLFVGDPMGIGLGYRLKEDPEASSVVFRLMSGVNFLLHKGVMLSGDASYEVKVFKNVYFYIGGGPVLAFSVNDSSLDRGIGVDVVLGSYFRTVKNLGLGLEVSPNVITYAKRGTNS